MLDDFIGLFILALLDRLCGCQHEYIGRHQAEIVLSAAGLKILQVNNRILIIEPKSGEVVATLLSYTCNGEHIVSTDCPRVAVEAVERLNNLRR